MGEPRLPAPRAVAAPRGGARSATSTAESCRATSTRCSSLTGIGDYTARAVAVFAYGDRHPVVDTNTRRVLARALDGRAQPGPPARADLAAMTALLPADRSDAAIVNAATMELGATVCTARMPAVRRMPDRACLRVARGGVPRHGR